MSVRTPLAVCLVLLAGLAAASALAERGGGAAAGAAPAPAKRPAAVGVIARRVERIRALRFRELPRPQRVPAAQARREGLADLDKSYPERRRRADEELYKLLGLLRPQDDLREAAASVYEGQVAGYYDPRSGALRVVDGGAPPNPVTDEITLAHELVHALEDQRYDLDLDDLDGSGDASLAHTALVEGTATAVMDEYQRRHLGAEEVLGGALAAALGAGSTEDLPPFILAQLLFPYLDGARFVNRLYATGGDTWRLVDVAERVRPPASTEQILHPESYLRVEAPLRVRGLPRPPGAAWRRVAAGVFGEWQTREWLARAGGGGAGKAAAGWGGDRYELWRRGPLPAEDCAAPCAARDVLVLRWRWDTARDAREFRGAVDGALGEVAEGAATAVRKRGRQVTVVLGGEGGLARCLASEVR